MVRTAQTLHNAVFLSVNNPLTQGADTQSWMQQLLDHAQASSVSAMVLAGPDRWLCLIEGPVAQVSQITAAMQRHLRPREWYVLSTNEHAGERMYPQHRMGWRSDATPLEMAAFLSDIGRYASRTQTWHISLRDAFELLEPAS